MKLSEVRPFVDNLVTDMAMREPDPAADRRALAEAFMAGVRSQGLRYTSDVKLWAACGCKPAEAKKESGT